MLFLSVVGDLSRLAEYPEQVTQNSIGGIA
jgi:hypothetical protein